ncbi:Rid family hydrolase [Varunaivibrio sulfuroxidans]|uniref:Enamine deaminase RidA (YjgF/YER057c/UK114 family) n=1 Tax=Varunaivibrio sulfuroxidans TaxID=1773489 RepID=A0A4R3JB39_9PROT|nr:Rid family hydrolase [Varunaivibrio sulfuroxidans]TCS63108.1 enamine deaminase RidA (YjgF/YER057c/UK114 family) [Varunaivibrio sulfuroxidans]WES31820.1 Rid family hydrolase [Varunaivibrio sulfuroxidans]
MSATDPIAHSAFSDPRSGTEHFIAVSPPPGGTFEEQVSHLDETYKAAANALGLGPETAIFRRLFLSDIMNQAPFLSDTELACGLPDNPVAVSIVQQPPLRGAKISMLAYHIESPTPMTKTRLSEKHIVMAKNGLRHLWSTRLCTGSDHGSRSVGSQTHQVFDDLIGALRRQGGTLRDNCMRTWIYLKDVDVFYQGMVDGRSELFVRNGMNGDTHYIASTGIEGACAHRHDLVGMDAYSVFGLAPKQVSHLNDFDHLCPTEDYNVTFERGTRIAYAERSQYFISGTASIDRYGQVVHPGDVMRQLERALDNIDALLLSGGARLEDMKYLIVYLRDPSDYTRVKTYLDTHYPNLPMFIVKGAICRPEWLVEAEGVAVARGARPDLPMF